MRKTVKMSALDPSSEHVFEAIPRGQRSSKMMLLKIRRFTKMNMFFIQSLPEAVQNRVQNRDFSENPRWGPYKNRKMFTKNRYIRGTLRKT